MTDSIIIGGGIIGMLTARNLRLAGQKVTLVEKSDTGRESSWAGGGIVSPLYPWRYAESITRLASWSQARYPFFCNELHENTGIDPEYTRNGLLILAPGESEPAFEWSIQFSRHLEILSSEDIAGVEPAMAATDKSGIWLENVGQVRNPRLTSALRADIEKLGVKIITQTEVVSIDTDNHRVASLTTGTGKLEADQYAVCTGAWTGELLEPLGVSIPVEPVQGQMILFKAEPGDIQRIVLEDDRYVIPRRDGRVLFGSTLEHVGFDKHITESARKELHDIAVHRFPVLKDRQVEHHWAGLRPGSPDGIPIISQHPELENLFINAGHFRNGVVLGPASCELMSEMMLGRETSFFAEDYALT
jgi:glycine oxidase